MHVEVRCNLVYILCHRDGSLISELLSVVVWFKFRTHSKLGQGNFSANIHDPRLPRVQPEECK